jgi:hypothetical protein
MPALIVADRRITAVIPNFLHDAWDDWVVTGDASVIIEREAGALKKVLVLPVKLGCWTDGRKEKYLGLPGSILKVPRPIECSILSEDMVLVSQQRKVSRA